MKPKFSLLFIVLGAVCFFLTMFALQTNSADRPIKVGYVNMGRVFDSYVKAKETKTTLEADQKVKQEEARKQEAEIKRLEEELQKKVSVLSTEEQQRREEEIKSRQNDLRNFSQQAVQELRKKEEELVSSLLTKIQSAIEVFGEKEQYSLILEKRAGGMAGQPILYIDEQLDITEQVIGILNKKGE